jgi:hypothetical protein
LGASLLERAHSAYDLKVRDRCPRGEAFPGCQLVSRRSAWFNVQFDLVETPGRA